MNNQEKQIKKVCGFYVNDSHLTTMILPYIHKEIEEKNQIITVLQNNMQPNIEEILSKMNLNEELKNNILAINWTSTFPVKYSKLKAQIEQIDGQANNTNIIIKGDKEFVKTVNQNIEKIIKKLKTKNTITIINFYNVTEFTNVSEITAKHEYILNTSGIKKVGEVFLKNA